MIGSNGQPVYDVYRNNPSDFDRQLLDQVNILRANVTPPLNALTGIIIDANRTTIFTENPGEKPMALPRCI